MEILRTFDIVSRMLSEFPKEDALAVNAMGIGTNSQPPTIVN